MPNSTGRYVLGMEVMTPTGMNLDVATSVATVSYTHLTLPTSVTV